MKRESEFISGDGEGRRGSGKKYIGVGVFTEYVHAFKVEIHNKFKSYKKVQRIRNI